MSDSKERFVAVPKGLEVKPKACGGGRIRTFDLRVMSPASYLSAPPRVIFLKYMPKKLNVKHKIKDFFIAWHKKMRDIIKCVWSFRPAQLSHCQNLLFRVREGGEL